MYQLKTHDTEMVHGGFFGTGVLAGIAASTVTGALLLTAIGGEAMSSDQFKSMIVFEAILGGTVGLLTDIGSVVLIFL